MTYSIVIVAYRKPGTTPEQFKAHYENSHIPLVRELAGQHFPLSHTRHYIHRSEGTAADRTDRNPTTPATVLMGSQADFDYDAYSELIFEDFASFQTFCSVVQQPENAAKIAADEEKFLDRTKILIASLGDTNVTSRT
ncbi:hypothetical protein K445DRAFT_21482 [Daldinia sp. EC12]|nr:hypothetical protein K445DRAFT_21482 [Daldinia sp. EC12]